MGFPSEGRGGQNQGPPAKLFARSATLARLNRHTLTCLLVTGGTNETRRAVARTIHEGGPLASGPFVHLDCAKDDARLRGALESCLLRTAESGPSPILAAWGGTLFLDRVSQLTIETQKLILCALERAHQISADGGGVLPIRFAAGDDENPEAAVGAGRLMRRLYDDLDKIRVDLDQHVAA